MSEATPLRPPPEDDRAHELALARRAVAYLESQGLARNDVISCLVSEFDLDERTAAALIDRRV